jgi:hypothetical protein
MRVAMQVQGSVLRTRTRSGHGLGGFPPPDASAKSKLFFILGVLRGTGAQSREAERFRTVVSCDSQLFCAVRQRVWRWNAVGGTGTGCGSLMLFPAPACSCNASDVLVRSFSPVAFLLKSVRELNDCVRAGKVAGPIFLLHFIVSSLPQRLSPCIMKTQCPPEIRPIPFNHSGGLL